MRTYSQFDASHTTETVLRELDLYSQAGDFGAFTYVVDEIAVTDESLTIALTTVIDNATISGFALYSADGGQFVEPPVPVCEPQDMTEQPTDVHRQNQGSPPSGGISVTIQSDPTLPRQTVYRPNLADVDKLPVVAWGNGACASDGTAQAEFLTEIASHGYLVIAHGNPGGSGGDDDHGAPLIAAIDWAFAENERACSQYVGKINVNKVATMGWSCGGGMAHYASVDPRVTTTVALNSGLFGGDRLDYYSRMHAPVGIFNGNSAALDVAYPNGLKAFDEITRVPVYHGVYPIGHGDAYFQDNGGEFGKVAVGWLNWWLKDDLTATGKGLFIGNNCRLCNAPWDVKHKGF